MKRNISVIEDRLDIIDKFIDDSIDERVTELSSVQNDVKILEKAHQ